MAMTREEVQAQHQRGVEAYQAGRWQDAADAWGDLFLEPEMLSSTNELHWNYAMCMAHLGNFPLALEHVRAGGYQETAFWEACHQQNLRDAQHDFESAAELYHNGQWREAADAFTELFLHPGMPADSMRELHWNLAVSLAHLDDFPTALEHIRAGGYDEADFWEACRQQNLRDAQHDFDAAVRLYQDGQWQQAADAFTELFLHPGMLAGSMDEMHWNLAMCLAHLGEWSTAFEHVRAGHQDIDSFRRATTSAGLHPPEE